MQKKTILVFLLFLLIINYAFAAKVYKVDATFLNQENKVIVNEVRAVEGAPEDISNQAGNYTVKILSTSNSLLSETKYWIAYDLIIHGQDGVSFYNSNESLRTLYLPFDEQAKFLVFERNGTEITRFDLGTQTCNNDANCDSFESNLTCPNDCPLGEPDTHCDNSIDGVCDEDCAENVDFDCRQEEFGNCGNNVCDSEETFESCRNDCSGRSDQVCDRIQDGRCDPDCIAALDLDCREDKCNYNGICEASLQENEQNCRQDCVQQNITAPIQPAAPPSAGYTSAIIVLLALVGLICVAWFFMSRKKES